MGEIRINDFNQEDISQLETCRHVSSSENPSGLTKQLSSDLFSLKGRRKISNVTIPIQIVESDRGVPTEDPVEEVDDVEPKEPDDEPAVKDGLFCNQDYHLIRDICVSSSSLFVDAYFPPEPQSLGRNHDNRIVWKRASELSDCPSLFVDGASRFDINQGVLGDCWLLATISSIPMNQEQSLVNKIVPGGQSFTDDYHGIFHFRLWYYGEWIDIVVDDYLPTLHGKLIYVHSKDGSEFWSSLLEKAYAKLSGSYSNLKGGNMIEAMVDLTGGVGRTFDIQEEDDTEDTFEIVRDALDSNSLVGGSVGGSHPEAVEGELECGLVQGHAYAINKAVKFSPGGGSDDICLLRLRNPWGDGTEWNGPWSDQSQEWELLTEEQKGALDFNDKRDGEFYMVFSDFRKYFDNLEICYLLESGGWRSDHFEGAWIGKTAGGCRNSINTFHNNPQFKFKINQERCVVSLMQKGTRDKRAKSGVQSCLTIGYSIYRVEDDLEDLPALPQEHFRYNLSYAKCKCFSNLRELSDEVILEDGVYFLIPSTFKPAQEGDFLLRIFKKSK